HIIKTCLLFLFISAVPAGGAHAQSSRTDSLTAIVDTTSGNNRYDALIALMLEYVQTDNDKAMQVIDQASEVALELGDTAKIVRTRRNKGQLLNRVGRSKEALDVSIPYLDVARRNNLRGEVKIILNNIAVAHTVLADYEKALETHL